MKLRRSALLAFVVATSTAVLTACGGGKDDTFGSIALSTTTGQLAFAWNGETPSEADRRARDECGASDCQVVLQFNQCGAFSVDVNSGVWGVAAAGSPAEAQAAADAQCLAKGGQTCTAVSNLPARCT